MSKLKYLLIISGVCLISSTTLAKTYSGDSFENRLKLMEKDIRVLNKEVYKNGVSPLSKNSQLSVSKSQMANLEVRLSSLENNIRKVKGEVERLNYTQEELAKIVEKLQKDIDFRLNDVEKRSSKLEKTKLSEVKFEEKKIDLSAFKKLEDGADKKTINLSKEKKQKKSIEEQYKESFLLLKDKKFEDAEKSFSSFIKNNPKHRLAGNAQYWLAETYYVRGDMETAMKQFANGYKNYKDSAKKHDNLLKLAITLGAIGKAEEACITIAELEKDEDEISSTIQTRLKNEKKKYKCSIVE